MKLEEATQNLYEDIEDLSNDMNDEAHSEMDEERAKDLKEKTEKIYQEINEIVSWKSFSYVYGYTRKSIKNCLDIFDIIKLTENEQLLSIADATKHLKLTEQQYLEGIKRDFIGYFRFIRLRTETLVEADYEAMRDLQSQARIGEYGQRLPDLFKDIHRQYPYPEDSLPRCVVNLIRAEDDIIKLIYTNIDIAMKYQAWADLTVYQIASISKEIKELKELHDLSNDVVTLREEKKNLIQDIEILKKEKAGKIEELENGEEEENEEAEKLPEPVVAATEVVSSPPSQLSVPDTKKEEQKKSPPDDSDGITPLEE
jgi:hypothetical protein